MYSNPVDLDQTVCPLQTIIICTVYLHCLCFLNKNPIYKFHIYPIYWDTLPQSCWTRICPAFASSVDPDQLASEEANWSGSALFVIKYVNLYQPGSSNLIGWKLETGMAS